MKRWIPSLCLLATSALFGGDDWSLNNHFNVYADFLYMERSSQLLHSKTLVRETIFNKRKKRCHTEPVLKSKNLIKKFDWEPGYRVGGIYMQKRWSVEGSFARINEWQSQETVTGSTPKPHRHKECDCFDQHWGLFDSYLINDHWFEKKEDWLYAPFICNGEPERCCKTDEHVCCKPPDLKPKKHRATLSYPFNKCARKRISRAFSDANEAVARYDSQFWTAELNYWRHTTPRRGDYFSFSWIAGMRYIDLDERTSDTFIKTRFDYVAEYAIKVKNQMPGPQVGLNIQVNPYRQWSWDFTGKIGGLVNNAHMDVVLQDTECVLRQGSSDHVSIALVVDLFASLTWNFFPYANLHLGYEMFYLSGVSLAPEQCRRSTKSSDIRRLRAQGEVLVDGAFLGLSILF